MTTFHAAFIAALNGDTLALGPWLTHDDGRLGVYRNTIATGLSEALEAAFPAVAAALGTDNFQQVAAAYAHAHPPRSPCLQAYALSEDGGGFAGWLEAQAEAEDMDWLKALGLGDLARLDRLWLEVQFAADEVASTPQAFAALSPDTLIETRARLIASARLIRFDLSIHSVWRALREGETEGLSRAPEAETLLIRRNDAYTDVIALPEAGAAFLRACDKGLSLGRAAQIALEAYPATNLSAGFAEWLGFGALKLIH